MDLWKPRLLRSMLNVMSVTGVHKLLGGTAGGVGAILTLHHVREAGGEVPFAPNRILSITPQFLAQTIAQIQGLDYDIVTLDEARRRLLERDFARKFVCITLDDGYRDNITHAAPVFAEFDVPYTVYVTTGMPEGTAVLWWQHLEDIVREHDQVRVRVGAEEHRCAARTTREKYQAFATVYWALRAAPQAIQQAAIRAMLDAYGVEPAELCRRWAMSWSELETLAAEPRASIGAHTVNHHALSKLPPDEARHEALACRDALAARLGRTPRHFCYPYGDRGSAGPREFALAEALGYATATTTRKGVLFAEHRHHLHALPRISLNGDYQRSRYVKLFLSGAPFALMNRFRRLDVA